MLLVARAIKVKRELLKLHKAKTVLHGSNKKEAPKRRRDSVNARKKLLKLTNPKLKHEQQKLAQCTKRYKKLARDRGIFARICLGCMCSSARQKAESVNDFCEYTQQRASHQ